MRLLTFFETLSVGVKARRAGDHIVVDELWLPPEMRGEGLGPKVYRQWEENVPRDVKYLKLMPVDYGQGDPTGFWEKMGFKHISDKWMAKGVNGNPTPQPVKEWEDVKQWGEDDEDEHPDYEAQGPFYSHSELPSGYEAPAYKFKETAEREAHKFKGGYSLFLRGDNVIEINQLWSEQEGAGTAMMSFLTNLADKLNVILTLRPEPYGTGLGREMPYGILRSWYYEYDFESTGHHNQMARIPEGPITEQWEDEEEEQDFSQLPSMAQAAQHKPEIVRRVQQRYDQWEQDEEGQDEELGSGGACHLFAEIIADVLNDAGFPTWTVSSMHEVHVYCVAQASDGVWEVDIPYCIYEKGGGYSWTKIPDVKFEPDDIVITRLSPDPGDIGEYADVEEW